MFNWLFGNKEYKVNHLDAAMALFEKAYMNDLYNGFSSEVANAAGVAAAEDYITQYLIFKERGL